MRSTAAFDYPLIPDSRSAGDQDASQLLFAISEYRHSRDPESFAAFHAYLAKRPNSSYAGTLWLDLGLARLRQGYYTQARYCFRQAWGVLSKCTDSDVKIYGDRALAEYALILGRSGDVASLRALLDSARDRRVNGPATERLNQARGMLLRLEKPGPGLSDCACEALSVIARKEGHRVQISERPGGRSTNLDELENAAMARGLDYMAAKRNAGAPLTFPAIAHFKLGHYAVVLSARHGRVWIQDGSFGGKRSLSVEAFDNESSGYFLIPKRRLRAGWAHVGIREASTICGAGPIGSHNASNSNDCVYSTTPCGNRIANPIVGPQPSNAVQTPKGKGMAVYDIQLMLDSLHITDTPVGYTPAVGPDVECTISYSQREYQDPPASSTNFGPKWRSSFISYVQDDGYGNNPIVFLRGGGYEANGTGQPDEQTLAVLTEASSSPIIWQRALPDGTEELYEESDNGSSTRNVYLSAVIDPQGNRETFSYSQTNGVRLAKITDAVGKTTTFSYGLAEDPSKVTRITDPYGRSASFTYTTVKPYHLASITDTIGISSRFTYASGSDFISSMQTPYGVSTFTTSDETNNPNDTMEWVNATNPLGQTERVEFEGNLDSSVYANSAPSVPNVPGLQITNDYLEYRNTFYWNRISYPEYAAGTQVNYQMAKDYHWCHQDGNSEASGILESVKEPLENRDYYIYGNQQDSISTTPGMTGSAPAFIARALLNGQTLTQTIPNALGQPVQTIDPVGRTADFTYAPNGLDLISEKIEGASGAFSTVFQGGDYVHHRPELIIDKGGQRWLLKYNAFGEILTLTDPLSEVTTFVYDAEGKLLQVKAPDGGTLANYTYDTTDRVKVATDEAGKTQTYAYDAADRITSITFGDGTTKKMTYSLLDVASSTDRQNRVTTYQYNALRQLILKRDPLGRATYFNWCLCGHLGSVFDASLHTTTWSHDIEGRVYMKTYDDGSYEVYSFEPDSGLLSTRTDAKGQTKYFTYNEDATVNKTQYFGGTATPSVSYTYDPFVPRLTEIVDGTGTTSYRYAPFGELGGGAVSQITGPTGTDPISFSYDALGRPSVQKVGSASETFSYDDLGRLKSDANLLGDFTYKYLGESNLPTAIGGGAVTTNYTYYPAPGDVRLKSLQNLNGTASLGSYGYTYNAEGTVASWSGAYVHGGKTGTVESAYDADDELTDWQVKDSSSNLLASESFAYDQEGNRSSTSNGEFSFQVNDLNELTKGTSTELGQTLTVDNDANGSIESIGLVDSKVSANSYSTSLVWDDNNRLISYTNGEHQTLFEYNGEGLCTKITEEEKGSVVATRSFLWMGLNLVEEKNASGTKYFLPQGVVETSGEKLYYARDHLGSVRQIVSAGHALVGAYQYDAFGVPQVVSGTYASDVGYAGYFNHSYSGLDLTPFRAYSSSLGRWLSRDPIAERGGLDLYTYCGQGPMSNRDPTGLICYSQALLGGLQILKGIETIGGLQSDIQKTEMYVIGGSIVLALIFPATIPAIVFAAPYVVAGVALYGAATGGYSLGQGLANFVYSFTSQSTSPTNGALANAFVDVLPLNWLSSEAEHKNIDQTQQDECNASKADPFAA